MKKLFLLLLAAVIMACGGIQGKLEKTAGPPATPHPPPGTAAELAAGTVTAVRVWSPKVLSDEFSASGIEAGAFDFGTWDANTNGGTKDAIRDQFFVYDTDGDGDIDNIDGAVGGGDITGVGPAGTGAGDALTDGYVTVGATLFIFEGTTDDTNEYIINMPAADPLGDLTWTFPSVTGTLLTADGVGTALTALDGENIQDDTIDDDSLDFSDITLDDFVSAEGDYISVAADDTFDFTRNDAGTVTLTASDDDGTAALTILPGGAAAFTLGGASTTTITATTDGGSITLDGLVAIGTDPADQGVIRLENATIIAWEDATETTITHVDDTGLAINTGLTVGGTFGATGVVSLGDGGDNFSVASTGIDIDTSGNITNAGTISSGKVTSSAAFESATGTFDVTGAAAITIGSADVTAVTITTDNTGDGSDLVLPAQSVNGSEMLNNTVTATQLSAALSFSDGDLVDLSGITHTVATDEGFVLPNWANVVPTSDKKFLAADGSNLKLYNGGWVTIGASAAPTDATYLTLSNDATLSAERVLTESTQGIDFTDAGANGTLTISLDGTEVDAITWSDGANASNIWTFDVSGTDHTMTAGNGLMTFSHAVTSTGLLTASAGISVAAAQSVSIGADPADAGAIRLSNAEYILSEAAPAGTDISVIGVDSSEVVQIGASGASGVTITPAVTFSGGIANAGTVSAGTWQGTAVADTYVADDITLTNITQITNRAIDDLSDGTYQRVLAADVDASGHVNRFYDADGTGYFTTTGLSVARAITLVDVDQTLANLGSNQAFTGDNTFAGTSGFNGEVTMGADFNINANLIQSTGNIGLKLGDADGTYSLTLYDSADAAVYSIDSNGVVTVLPTADPYVFFNDNDMALEFAIRSIDTTTDHLAIGTTNDAMVANFTELGYFDVNHFHYDGNINITTGHTFQINDTQIALTNLSDGLSHAAGHERAGADQIDGDHLDIDFTPSNYTPATTPAEAANVDDLTAHLYGIDAALGALGGGTVLGLTDVGGSDVYTAGYILIADGTDSYDPKQVTGEITLSSAGEALIANTGVVLTSLTVGSLLGVDSIDATGAVDMDYGSADITDHTFTTDGGTVILDGTITAAGTITSSGTYDVTGATDLTLGSADVTAWVFSGISETLTLTPSADLVTATSASGVATFDFGTINLATDALDVSDGNITNVGNIAIDSITADATNVLFGTGAATQLQFRDTALHIASLDDGHLDLTADTSIDLNGAVVATSSIAASGIITGLVNTSAAPASLTNFNGSYTVSAVGSTSLTLPTAVAGYSVCIRQGQGRTDTLSVTPAAGDYIVKDGVRGTIATAISSGGAATDKACFVAVDSTDWYMDYTGTWAE